VFSAGVNFVTELEQRVAPVFVGEPAGGSPNQCGDARPVDLPRSGLVVHVSTRWWEKGGPGDTRLCHEPAIPVHLSSVDYFAGCDPVLDAARDAGDV